MDATQLHNLFRAEMRDNEEPYLFDSTTIYSYIDAAQVEFCRLTEGIEDARTFEVSVTAGEEWCDINPRILKVRRAYDKATGRPVNVVNLERVEQQGIRFDGRTGPLQALVAGAEKNSLRAWPVPSQDATIQLEVFRLPRQVVGRGDCFEIDEQHHIYLLDWAKHMAFGTRDADLFDPRASANYKTSFMAYCARAKAEQVRARHQSGAVQYGGL